METPRNQNDSLTPSQRQAVAARGNVLVMAGAGTGKTKTLVARCLDCLDRERASLDELLIVTFTEAAAAEMRLRLRRELEKKSAATPDDDHWPRQLALFDIAHIGTLHSFCLRLVREHFHELGLDPQLAILGEGEARQLASEMLDEQFQSHYEGEDEFSVAVQNLIQVHGGGRDEKIRALILRLYHYSQTRPDAAGWLAEQIRKFSASEPVDWQCWLLAAITGWRDEWLPVLNNLKSENEKAAELLEIFLRVGSVPQFTRELAAEVLKQILSTDGKDNFPKGKLGALRQPLEDLFDEAAFLAALAPVKNGSDPLAEDWAWVHGHMETLLRLAQEFAGKFSGRKHADGALDFHDLEQFALKLLWNFAGEKPASVAEVWRKKFRFVFVDEYQDINAVQDKIITALSRDGAEANRFLVGDVKQSIYRFRLADPKIFRDYSKNWHGKNGQVIPLAENFRSREALLNFANSVFSLLMYEEIGGVAYDAEAQLKFGAPEKRAELGVAKNPEPRVELLLRTKKKAGEVSEDENGDLADLDEMTKEARLVALRLKQLITEQHKIWDDEEKIFRAAEWRDVAVLLRSPWGRAEIFAKQFELVGVPLVVTRGGFFDSREILDLLSLLQLLDNPLQDVPCIAVLRSPLVGLSLDELAEIRLAAKDKHFWTAFVKIRNPESGIQNELRAKLDKFFERFLRWRKLARQVSLSQCLEQVLAETYYTEWLRAQSRGAQRAANIERFLNLVQSFDQFQRQGLFRFLKFIEAQREAGAESDAPAVSAENAVRLMSIHQSKGLEFPVVVLADLANNFNEQDLRSEIIFDDEFGLCPKVKPPHTGRRYPSLPHWLAQRRQKCELRGEELRLFYVALTRTRDTLILSTGVSETKWATVWTKPQPVTAQKIARAKSFADWLAIWFSVQSSKFSVQGATQGEFENFHWRFIEDEELANRRGETAGEQTFEDSQDGSQGRSPHPLESLDDATAEKLRAALSWKYPHEAATKCAAKSSVTELRRAAEALDDEAEQVFTRPKRSRKKMSAAEFGTAHHKFLQHFALEKSGDLAAEAERLTQENYLSADERAVLDLAALAGFWNSELGGKIRMNAANVRRELPFTARFSPAEIAEIKGEKPDVGLENEFVVMQGVADLVVLQPEEIWIADFKTDDVRADEMAGKIESYKPQLKFYAAALEKIFARRVTLRALHFFAARHTEKV